jgi:hypothetical protein
VNPASLAAGRWKVFRQAQERVEQASRAHKLAVAKLEELRAQEAPTALADRQALGAALVDGKAEPEPQTVKLQNEIVSQERRVAALLAAIDDANAQLAATITSNRAAWHRDAVRATARAAGRYERAIEELDASRQALSDEVGLAEWCASGGAAFGEAANDALAGRTFTRPGEPPPLSFTKVIATLREDIKYLSEWSALDREIDTPTLDWALIRRAGT